MTGRLRDERGMAMVLVVFATVVLSVLGVGLLELVRNEQTRSSASVKSQEAFQAAEAGLDDYLAKIVDDKAYYLHQVHVAESTRRPPSGADIAAGNAWTHSRDWTYPNGKDAWKALGNGYEYNLQITAPAPGLTSTTIVATGRKVGSTSGARSVEVLVRPSVLSDFYRLVNGNVSWGSGASTYGKIYANGDIDHDGTAYASIYAEGSITGSVSMQNGSQKYTPSTSPSIRTKIPNPINFANFLVSFSDISRAATVSGNHFDDPTKVAWRIDFQSNGTYTVRSCSSLGGGNPIETTAPTGCGSTTTHAVPSNGAIYTAQTVIVEGDVKGRVTVGSGDDIVVADAIAPVTPGQDVIGLAAYQTLWIPEWAPDNLTWTASVLVQTDTWRSAGSNGSHGAGSVMTFTGSAATNLGGGHTAFTTRNYSYDQNLQFLSPPWFPVLDDILNINLFREIPA